MKWCPDNQINALFIEILRIKWLAPKPIIGPHPVEQTAFRRNIKDNMDINPSLQICG